MAFTDPKKNLSYLKFFSTMKVADLGAGNGAYTLELAKAIGPDGKVYAVEVQKDLLEVIKKNATTNGLQNVEVIWGDIEKVNGTGLADSFVDAVVISNILFQMSSIYVLAQEIKRILKTGGQLLIVEWRDSFGGIGPEAGAVVRPEKAKEVFSSVGFEFNQEFEAGDEHYGLVFIKK